MEGKEGKDRKTGRECNICGQRRAALRRPKTCQQVCRECFYFAFEEEIHKIIADNQLFKPGERVAIAASGGKDSTVLAHVLTELNQRHNYGLDLFLLSIDEGIAGYRDDSLETVKRNEVQYGIPLKVVSDKSLYGWTMDEIVKEIGLKNNCTFCGVFRRQALDRGAAMLGVDKLATGHNADDIAETVLLNILRGDIARLSRCTLITTGEDGPIPRCKPFKYAYEKEIVMYAYFKKLDYFSTECIYSPNAYRGFARDFIKDLEQIRPRAILDIIRSGENFRVSSSAKMPEQGVCERCGYISSQEWCKACVLLDGLNRGLPKLGISRTRGRNGQKMDNEPVANGEAKIPQDELPKSKQCGSLDFWCISTDENIFQANLSSYFQRENIIMNGNKQEIFPSRKHFFIIYCILNLLFYHFFAMLGDPLNISFWSDKYYILPENRILTSTKKGGRKISLWNVT